MEGHFGGNAERRIIAAQERSQTLGELADGYRDRLPHMLGKLAPAVHAEVRQKIKGISDDGNGEGDTGRLDGLLKAIEPFKAILRDVPDDPDERRAFALALVRQERGLQ